MTLTHLWDAVLESGKFSSADSLENCFPQTRQWAKRSLHLCQYRTLVYLNRIAETWAFWPLSLESWRFAIAPGRRSVQWQAAISSSDFLYKAVRNILTRGWIFVLREYNCAAWPFTKQSCILGFITSNIYFICRRWLDWASVLSIRSEFPIVFEQLGLDFNI